MFYELECEFDARDSFYGKAQVEELDGLEILYSYDERVAEIDEDEGVGLVVDMWDYSDTTLRHVKEFLRQHGFEIDSVDDIRDLLDDGEFRLID